MLKEVWKADDLEWKGGTQVLGIGWDTESNTLSIDPRDVTEGHAEGPATKRQILQVTARFYDPLGLLSPVSVIGKLLFQDTWRRGIAWDEILPPDLGSLWNTWISSLPHLMHLRIPRWIGTLEETTSQVHVFCDISERAYGAALYVLSRNTNGNQVRLVCSKNGLVPVKRVTLPWLELLAVLVGTRLLQCFCQATRTDTTKEILWTVLTVTLGWILQDPNRWKIFLCNRVTEIQTYTTPSQWRHCPGKDNPADLLSRGITADQRETWEIWWNGPSWLVRKKYLYIWTEHVENW
jgi:hypothetical protein